MKILEVCVDLDGGGIDRYLLNYCSRIEGIHFDFAVVDSKRGILEPQLEALDCKIYRVPRQSAGLKANYNALKKIMTDNIYDAVHVHLGYKGAVALLCAKNCGIKTRIVHAHIAAEPENFKQKIIRKVFTFFTKLLATDLAACGVYAAKWVWGNRAYKKGEITIHNNAIETKKYAYSLEKRESARKQLGISEETFVVGHGGRLCSQKNQLRLLDIFNEIQKVNPNSVLLLVGRGELEKAVKDKAIDLGIADKVHLLGVRDDVAELLNAFDIFVFPSTHEGLPFTLIETQCNGVYTVSSDAVTSLVKLGDCVQFLALSESDDIWAQTALALAQYGHNVNEYKVVAESGYDIEIEAKKLKEYYLNFIKAAE